MIILPANLADAAAMAALRQASIRQLCGADHQQDEVAIAAWVGGPDKFVRLLQRPEAVLVVA
ncbi:MAG: hypothetical protein WBA73_15545, partial [Devosia sp.]